MKVVVVVVPDVEGQMWIGEVLLRVINSLWLWRW